MISSGRRSPMSGRRNHSALPIPHSAFFSADLRAVRSRKSPLPQFHVRYGQGGVSHRRPHLDLRGSLAPHSELRIPHSPCPSSHQPGPGNSIQNPKSKIQNLSYHLTPLVETAQSSVRNGDAGSPALLNRFGIPVSVHPSRTAIGL